MNLTIMMTAIGDPLVLQPERATLSAPLAGEVQIRQTVIGVNFVDIYHRIGLYRLPALPAVLGFEAAGRVEAIGPGVTALSPGDRVAYTGTIGAYAERRNIAATRLVRLPDAISDRVAGSSMLRGLTAHMLLFKVHRIGPGDWVLVHAAAGGLGQIVTRWAKRLGARVIGTVGSPAKAGIARAAGADDVLLHGDASWVQRAREIADGKGVHLAVDGIGGDMLAQSLAAVRPFGVVASVGQVAGPVPPINIEGPGFARSVALIRPSSIAYANDPESYRIAADDLLAALEDGLSNPIGAEYPLRDAAKAHDDLGAGRTTGSVILTT